MRARRRGFENGVKKHNFRAPQSLHPKNPKYAPVLICEYIGLCVFELDEELMSMCVNVFYALYVEFEVHPLKLDNKNLI